MNIAIINQSGGKYLFEVPDSITLKEGEKVKCDTRRGITDGIVWADSITADEPAAKLIGKLLGAKFPLKSVVGKTVTSVEMFEQPEQPKQEDKPKFKVGDKVRVTERRCGHGFNIGEIVTLAHSSGHNWKCSNGRREWFLVTREFEPYTEPESTEPKLIVTKKMLEEMGACQSGVRAFMENFPSGGGEFDAVVAKAKEVGRGNDACWLETRKRMVEEKQNEPKQGPVKLYCVEGYKPYLTKGKIYETDKKSFTYDNGFTDKWCHFDTDHFNDGSLLKDHFVPLVSRPAKVGEWVYINDNAIGTAGQHKGKVVKITSIKDGGYSFFNPDDDPAYDANLVLKEYLVLDGYKPEPEKAEPEYYSGKVVCVESHDDFTVGKVYEFANGQVADNRGIARSYGYFRAKSLDGWNSSGFGESVAKFIEFKGE